MMEILITFILGFVVGIVYRDFAIYKRAVHLMKMLQRGKQVSAKEALEHLCGAKFEITLMNKNDPSMAVSKITKLKHEVVNDVHYFFTVDDDKFVAQGFTLEEAAIHYSKESGKESVGFFVHATQQKMLCFVDNKCMDYIDESSV
jgi:hypothetical protein